MIWIARDTTGNVYAFTSKPKKNAKGFWIPSDSGGAILIGGKNDYPEIVYERPVKANVVPI